MRILFDSKNEAYKTPFGTLTPGQSCTLNVSIPSNLQTSAAEVILEDCEGKPAETFPLTRVTIEGDYDIFSCTFRLQRCGLYFYYFRITAVTGPFRLFRQGRDTNMEAGDKWQLSCIPADFQTPDWAKGAVMYQIFPDRFFRSGACSTAGKLQPFHLHENWEDTPEFRPDAHGEVQNNDFFGGNFRGIEEKLPYLKSLGVSVVYLNPVVKAYSNHRYDAADFKTPDPLLGTEEDYRSLCEAAHRLGMHVIFDAVFSHTGSNSIYFDAKGTFGGGAASDPDSPYRSWYQFQHYPDEYTSWWGIKTLPCVNKHEPSYIHYIIDDADSVAAHWMKLGADGFRLDVVDELPDDFVLRLKRRIRSIRPDALLLGEVWEDASNKVAYDVSRRYFVDGELDSTMNYPWQKAIIRFVKGQDDGAALAEAVMTIAENYPPQVLQCVMNLLGTHDTARILTMLGTDFTGSKEQTAERRLTAEERRIGTARLKQAAFLQYTLPGMPSIYYGDEAGMEGFADPFNRRCFPWGKEDGELLAYYQALGRLKTEYAALRYGTVRVEEGAAGRFAFTRQTDGQTLRVYVNRTEALWTPAVGKVLFAGIPLQNGAIPPGGTAVIECP